MRMQAKRGAVAELVVVAGVFAVPVQAQVRNSGASPIALNAVLTDSITLTLSGNAVNFNLVAGSASNPGTTSITPTTTWVLKPRVGILKLSPLFLSSPSPPTYRPA